MAGFTERQALNQYRQTTVVLGYAIGRWARDIQFRSDEEISKGAERVTMAEDNYKKVYQTVCRFGPECRAEALSMVSDSLALGRRTV